MNRTIYFLKDSDLNSEAVSDEELRIYSLSNESLPDIKVVAYIEAASYLQITIDQTHCIICNKLIDDVQTLRTDGTWIWSADLEHYYQDHHFFWPRSFLQRMKSLSYKLSPISDSRQNTLLKLVGTDGWTMIEG
jgi:hypothetical protein